MLTPHIKNVVDLTEYAWWGADTGCFAKPELYTTEGYVTWLTERSYARKRNIFATAPDAWNDGKKTLEVARPVLPLIRKAGYKAALVAQSWITNYDIPWGEFDVLFSGGPDDWKTSQEHTDLFTEAVKRDVWCHMGRCNSRRRLYWSAKQGYKSADGTLLCFGPNVHFPKLKTWMERLPLDMELYGTRY